MIPLLSIGEVSRVLNVSKITIRRLVGAGELPVIRMSKGGPLRFDPKDLEKFIAEHKA